MNRRYLVQFSETVVEDGIRRPRLPWDGLEANVHCVYPRAAGGQYLESHVIAAVEADAKVHAQIIEAVGVTVLPDDVTVALKDVPTGKRSEIEAKAAALKADTKDVTADTPVKAVIDRIGRQLKPTFDLVHLQPLPMSAKFDQPIADGKEAR